MNQAISDNKNTLLSSEPRTILRAKYEHAATLKAIQVHENHEAVQPKVGTLMSAKPDQPRGKRSKLRWLATPRVTPNANQRSGMEWEFDAKVKTMKGTRGP